MPHDAKIDAQSIGGNVELRREILGKRSKYDDLMDLAKKKKKKKKISHISVSRLVHPFKYMFLIFK